MSLPNLPLTLSRGGGPPNIVTGTGASPRVAFWTGASTLGSDADFTWAQVTNLLNITGPANENDAAQILSGRLVVMNDPGGVGTPARRANQLALQYASTPFRQFVAVKEHPQQIIGGGNGNKPAGLLLLQTDINAANVSQAPALLTLAATRTANASLGSSFTAVGSGDILGRIAFCGDDTNAGVSGSLVDEAARIEFAANATATADAVSGNMIFALDESTSMFRWHATTLGAGETTLGELARLTSAALNVGATQQFQVAVADGDLQRIKDVPYDWPVANAAGYLRNTGAGALSWDATGAGIDHGGLSGLTDDDHSQYLLLAGRTGTTNNPLLSTSTDGTITGSSVSGGDLVLDSTSHATVGTINALDELVLRVNFPTPGAATTAAAASFSSAITLSASGAAANILQLAPTGTLSHVSAVNRLAALDFAPSLVVSGAGHAIYGLRMRGTVEYENALSDLSLMSCETVLFADDNGVAGPPNADLVNLVPTFRMNGSGIGLIDDIRGVTFRPIIETNDTADFTVTSVTAVSVSAQIDEAVGSALTVTEVVGLEMLDPTVVGSPGITQVVGVKIPTLTAGGTNLSLLSGGASVQMRHVGNVRVGDSGTSPTEKLEVLGNVLIDNSGSSGELRIREPSAGGSSYTGFKSPALSANVMYTLPPDDGDSGEQLTTDGSGVLTWEAAGGSGSLGTHIFARFTSTDTRTSNTVFANANDGTNTLQFAVAISQTWVFTVLLNMSVASATPDMKVQFTGPATVTAFAAAAFPNDAGVAAPTYMNALSTSSGVLPLANATTTAVLIRGMVVTDGTNSGNVTLQWAQNTSNASTVTMAATSWLHAQRIV